MDGSRRIRPTTHFASVGDSDIAYQVIGDGPIDLLAFGVLGFSTQAVWNHPVAWEFYGRLASVFRVIVFDRRGTGASDPVPGNVTPTWESLAEDAGAVLDAAGSQRAAIFAQADAAPLALLFTATHPERVCALVLMNAYARYVAGDDYPIGVPQEVVDWVTQTARTGWGREFARLSTPSAVDDEAIIEILATGFLSSATPRSAAAQYAYLLRDMDARNTLPLINVPTLVVHSRDNRFLPIGHSKYLAEHIAGARFIELDEPDILPGGDTAARLADEIAELVTGQRPIDSEFVLATVLFTDIVDSTATAASLGDRRWRSLLEAHNTAVHDQLGRFRGQAIKTTGDGFVATFTGPARAIRCAQAITDAVQALGLEVRAGLHTGECEILEHDLGGVAVHIAARVAAAAGPHEVLVSSTVKDLVIGSGIDFDDRGEHELKGVPGIWKLYAAR